MDIKQLNFDGVEYCQFRYQGSISNEKLKKLDDKQPEVKFIFSGNNFIISYEDIQMVLIVENSEQERLLNKIRQFADRTILKLQNINSNNIYLKILIFYRKLIFTSQNPLTFSINDKFKIAVRKIVSDDRLIKFLEDTFIFDGNKCFFQYLNGRNDSDLLSGTLFGEGYYCKVEYNEILQQVSLIEIKNFSRDIYGSVVLIEGAISFVDGIEKLKEAAAKIYKDEEREQREFEQIWNAYNEAMLAEARDEVNRIGFRRYIGVNFNPLRFKLDLRFNEKNDAEFLNSNLGYAVCSDEIFQIAKDCAENSSEPADIVEKIEQITTAIFIGDYLKKDSDKREFQTDFQISDFSGTGIEEIGYIFAPLTGSKVMHDRRQLAYNKINDFKNPLPVLKTIITGGKTLAINFQGQNKKAVNAELSKKVFGKRSQKFTERQKEAIQTAINTPDVAIIQGPPGTGKTTIIKAIVARLNDIYRDSQLKILITSTQHDAVDNAIENMECGGIPPYRFGKKQGKEFLNLSYHEKWIQNINDVCEKFLENDNDNKERYAVRRIYSLLENLNHADIEKDFKHCQELVGELHKELKTLNFSPEILEEIDKISNRIVDLKFETPTAGDDLYLKKLIEMQRTNSISFGDDGKRNLTMLKFYIDFNFEIQNDWEIPATWNKLLSFKTAEEIPDELFSDFENELQTMREKFFGKTITDNTELHKKDIHDALQVIKAAVDSYGKDKPRSIYDVIREFQEQLQNPANLEDIFKRYTKILAATCQQSAAKYATLNDDLKRIYDYVIIDEAAHSNPLDLLIPMSMGRFIILVGDQKQLPPMLEENIVERLLDENLSAEEKKDKRRILEEPLFQRLYNSLIKNYETKRVVMLREQYRMHPTIGKFVSDNFYDGQLVSPLPAELKAHNLGLYKNSAVAWLDVGKNCGLEEKVNYSIFRTAEVDCVCKEVEKILSLNKDYTVGIITFYKLQEERILKYCDNLAYQQKMRVQAGTVDAFQGKEFDIVILSAVRCNTNKNLRTATGFLSSMNRLCVAFSRAKRLLVVVGDFETIGKIQTFKKFYQLCIKEGYFGNYRG